MQKKLTPEELSLVKNAHFIYTKTNIVQAVFEIFGHLTDEYRNHLLQVNFEKINTGSPKISKGENYKGLPYVMLDYPRNFSKEGTFAIRTFFWWGNFFSITLHLSGSFQSQWRKTIQKAIEQGHFSDWYINASNEEWEHHFEDNNYQAIHTTKPVTTEEFTCLKLAKKIPLDEWENANDFLLKSFTELIQIFL